MESCVPRGETRADQVHSGRGERRVEYEPPDEHDHHAHAAGPSAGHDDCGHLHAGLDPHIWLSPRLLKHQAQTVASSLQELDPENAELYRQNLDPSLKPAISGPVRVPVPVLLGLLGDRRADKQ